MLTPEALDDLDSAEGFHFCATTGCATVYAQPGSHRTFDASQLRVPVFQKVDDLDRPVCYCFRHTVRDVERDARSLEPRIAAEIRDKCRAGLDRCEEENPQGNCCLGNVGKVAKLAKTQQLKDEDEVHDRCAEKVADPSAAAADPPTQPLAPQATGGDGSRGGRSALYAAGGATIAAVLSSACCWLPLSFIAVGVSAGGIGTFFEAYRVHFLVLTALMLTGGFYFVYRKPKCAPGDACATPNRHVQKLNKVMLWAATALVGVFAFFPNYVEYALGGDDQKPEGFSAQAAQVADKNSDGVMKHQPGANGVARAYTIHGMSCAGCTTHVRDSLRGVPNVSAVQVSYEDKLARVTFAAGSKPNDAAVLTAIKDLGFEATVQ